MKETLGQKIFDNNDIFAKWRWKEAHVYDCQSPMIKFVITQIDIVIDVHFTTLMLYTLSFLLLKICYQHLNDRQIVTIRQLDRKITDHRNYH